jgi:hypothetical protein
LVSKLTMLLKYQGKPKFNYWNKGSDSSICCRYSGQWL